ncbi:MAG: hypothetical protein GF383_16660 [Candidatus Lokiarchaeota archaeon]|nr:hypothetical protein [Candidatus Lokiarchaeota archaeon]MBD3343419.1 hypothetical protein [Candidatus Lokiarchaeota archaeon]
MFKKYRHWSHLGIGGASLLLWFSSIIAFLIEFTTNINHIRVGWMYANIFLYLAIWLIILSLIIAQFDKLTSLSHIVTIVVGILIGLITNPNNVEIYEKEGSYSASYTTIISLLGGVVFIIFLITAVTPLLRKIMKRNTSMKNKPYILTFLAYVLFTLWIVGLFFTSIPFVRSLRRFLFSLAIFFWSIALYMDPLTIVISKSRVQKGIVLTKTGLPIFSYDFEKQTEMDSSILVGVLSAIKSSLEIIVSSGNSLERMHFEGSVLNFINGNKVVLVLVSSETLSSNIKLVAKLFIDEFEARHKDLIEKDMVETDEMSDVIDLMQNITNRVLL